MNDFWGLKLHLSRNHLNPVLKYTNAKINKIDTYLISPKKLKTNIQEYIAKHYSQYGYCECLTYRYS